MIALILGSILQNEFQKPYRMSKHAEPMKNPYYSTQVWAKIEFSKFGWITEHGLQYGGQQQDKGAKNKPR